MEKAWLSQINTLFQDGNMSVDDTDARSTRDLKTTKKFDTQENETLVEPYLSPTIPG